MLTCTLDNENLKTVTSYKGQLVPKVTPLFKQLCEKLVLLEIIILQTPMYCLCVYLRVRLYASIAADAMSPQLLSVSF